MKATELRIGNWVKMKMSDTIENYQISAILEKGVNSGSVGMIYDIIEPIPLTDEWLERFGFDNSYKKEWWKGQIIYDAGFVSKEVPAHGTYVRYVHQLQNLYFALTGEELELK